MRSHPRLLVATDFSPGGDRAVELAVELAHRLDGELQLLHAWALPTTMTILDAAIIPSAARVAHALGAAQSRLEEAAARVRSRGLPVEALLREGEPAAVIVGLTAEGDVDLVVVGARGQGAIAHALLGSVAERVARHASRPVLVAR